MKGPRQVGTAVTRLGFLCPGRLGQGEAHEGFQQQMGCVGRCGASPLLQCRQHSGVGFSATLV